MTQIALLGFGVVGGGVAEVLIKNAASIAAKIGDSISIKYILDLRDFPEHPLGNRVVHDFNIILNDPEITVVAEMMGGSHPAYDFSLAALNAGKNVVTSNKEVVAGFGAELLRAAKAHHVRYLFEASVGGGIPVLHPIAQCLTANTLTSVDGILNGTTNYILTQMFTYGKSFEDALSEAQEKGYAERNPAADIEGIDACRKICILGALAFGKSYSPADVHTEGITKITAEDVRLAAAYGGTIKLLGSTGLTEPENPASPVYMLVSPAIVPEGNPIYGVSDVYNSILVHGNAVGDVMFYGRGAGNLPTASAVAGDIIDIVLHKNSEAYTPDWEICAGDALVPYDTLPYAFLARIAYTGEKDAVKETVRTCIADVEFLSETEKELAFVTPTTTERDLREKLSAVGQLLSLIRILK